LNKSVATLRLEAVKPLFHPSIEEVTVEGILYALADPVRLALYGELVASTCSLSCSSLLGISDKTVPKSTLSQHFRLLREAGLIRSERRGVEMQNSSRCAEIEQRFPGLIPAILAARGAQQRADAPRARAGRRKPPVRKAS
jgi:DNA-binding transcriptional ArsR family regulator